MALDTVSDYVAAARVLLQDTVAPYRYEDTELVLALTLGVNEARRIRPDLFLGQTSVESFTTNDTTAVTFDAQYRTALLYYVCAHAHMRDEENTEDARAGAFMARFNSQLVSGTA